MTDEKYKINLISNLIIEMSEIKAYKEASVLCSLAFAITTKTQSDLAAHCLVFIDKVKANNPSLKDESDQSFSC